MTKTHHTNICEHRDDSTKHAGASVSTSAGSGMTQEIHEGLIKTKQEHISLEGPGGAGRSGIAKSFYFSFAERNVATRWKADLIRFHPHRLSLQSKFKTELHSNDLNLKQKQELIQTHAGDT